MLALLFAFLLSALVLLPEDGAMAQQAPAAQTAAPDAAKDAPGMSAADIAAAREQQRTTAATRQQIQAIRAALRARLATLHR